MNKNQINPPSSSSSDTSFKKEVTGTGWNWKKEDLKTSSSKNYSPLATSEYDEKIVGYETAQKNIDEILAATILCEVTGKPFKIIRKELVFYIENSLPIPRFHPDQRHKNRMQKRNPRMLFDRTCAECGKAIMTTYSPQSTERVVCEECYRKLVY